MIVLWVRGTLPGLNDLVDLRIQSGRPDAQGRRGNKYTDVKRSMEDRIVLFARTQRFPRLPNGGHFTYLCKEPDARRDPSNILGGAMKLIEDALVKEELLPNDGQKHVHGIASHVVVVGKEYDGVTVEGEPGVVVLISGASTLSRAPSLAFDLLAMKRGYRNGRFDEKAAAAAGTETAARAGDARDGGVQTPPGRAHE